MSKPVAGAMLSITLNPASEIPLFHQLYSHIRDSILTGRLPPGGRLPSSRTLAADLAISRTTVLTAFDQLTAEGYLEGRVGAGTQVVSTLPETLLRTDVQPTPARLSVTNTPIGRSQRQRWLPPLFSSQPAMTRPFQAGNPDLTAFPRNVWARLMARHWRRAPTSLLGYGDAAGVLSLRAAIAEYAHRVRGVRCRPEQVLVVNGSQQALYLCGQVLLARNDVVWMEDPGYPGARAAFAAAGAKIVPVPVDDEGLVVETTRTKERLKPQLVYVTPSHQCPLGVAMSLPRRLELLEHANRTSAWIVEDDYDSEYRYFSRPLASLQSLDPSDRVIYIGTFSKTLLPALRLGYVILPESLVGVFTLARAVIDRQPGSVEQLALADFIGQGCLERHIRQTRLRYLERQEALVESIRAEMPDLLQVSPSGAGMYLTGWLRAGISDTTAARAADDAGITVIPLSRCFIGPARRDGLVLGYGPYGVEQIRMAVTSLARALRVIAAAGRSRRR